MNYVEKFGRQAFEIVGKPPTVACALKRSICGATFFNRTCRECLEEHFNIPDTLEERE